MVDFFSCPDLSLCFARFTKSFNLYKSDFLEEATGGTKWKYVKYIDFNNGISLSFADSKLKNPNSFQVQYLLHQIVYHDTRDNPHKHIITCYDAYYPATKQEIDGTPVLKLGYKGILSITINVYTNWTLIPNSSIASDGEYS